MRDNQKPLDFLLSLLEPSQFALFADYVINHLCEHFKDGVYGVIYQVPDPQTLVSKMYVKYYPEIMEEEIVSAKEKVLSDMGMEIIQKEDLKYKAVIVDHYYTSISYLASKIDAAKHLEPYPFVKEIITNLKTTLDDKYQPVAENNTCTKSKFQWLGNTNVLTTLFHDLLYGQNKKPALLIAKELEVKKFLLEHFIDKDGNNLSPDTINKYFSASHKHAKPGDKIVFP